MTDIEEIRERRASQEGGGYVHSLIPLRVQFYDRDIDTLLAVLAEKDENTALLIKTNQKATDDLIQHKKEIAEYKVMMAAHKLRERQQFEEIAALTVAKYPGCKILSLGDGCPCKICTLEKENAALKAEVEGLREALESIAANTCCEPCQEAALVARAALSEGKP